MRVKTFISAGLLLLLVLWATPAYAIPALPHAFYGTVTINNSSAPAGTQVSAAGTGVMTAIPQNPVTTTVAGQYGNGGLYLLVQGDITPGATITFYVNGVSTGQTWEWHSGETKELNLSVTIAPAAPSGNGDVGPATYYGGTTIFGIEGRLIIDSEGKILKAIEATSADGMLTVTIPEGTIALDKHGNPLSSLTADIDTSPPPPPEDANIIGLTYDFGPDGATFDPPITFTWSYDPDALPEDVAEEDLVIAYYDEDAGEWVELPSTVDPVTHTITVSVSNFTCFAIIGAAKPAAFTLSSLVISPAEVGPDEKVNISISVANTGGREGSYTVVLKLNGVKEAEKSITIAAGRSQVVSFSVTKEDAGSYSVVVNGLSGSFIVVAPPVIAPPPPVVPAPPAPPPAPPAPPPAQPVPPAPAPPNWPLIGGLIAAAVIVGLLIYFLVVRRRAY